MALLRETQNQSTENGGGATATFLFNRDIVTTLTLTFLDAI